MELLDVDWMLTGNAKTVDIVATNLQVRKARNLERPVAGIRKNLVAEPVFDKLPAVLVVCDRCTHQPLLADHVGLEHRLATPSIRPVEVHDYRSWEYDVFEERTTQTTLPIS